MDHAFACRDCGETVDPSRRPPACPDCAGELEVSLDLDGIDRSTLPSEAAGDDASLWRYRDLLPTEGIAPVTMGEGWTPLIEADRLSGDGPSVSLKNETANPTWSFKDRLNSLVLSHAAAEGATRVAVTSTGNHGASTAAYASRAGLDRCVVFLPPSTEAPHGVQIRAYGGEALVTEDGARDDLVAALVDRGWFSTSTVPGAYTGQPYAYEGYKTIAFEIVEQAGVPDAVSIAVGRGDGLYGIWKGFRELAELGAIESTPRLIAAEAEERAPLTRALAAGADEVDDHPGPLPITTSTKGTGAGRHALEAVRASEGGAYAVGRDAVERAYRAAGRDGVFLEPASALAPAVVEPAVEAGLLDRSDTVVAVATGAGVTWPGIGAEIVGEAPRIEPTLEALRAAVPFPID